MSQAGPDDTAARRINIDTAVELRTLVSEFKKANGLFADLSTRIRRMNLWQGAAGGVFVVVSALLLGHSCVTASRLSDVTAQLDSTVQLLEQVRTEQDQTQQRVVDVGVQVAEARAEAPTITLTPSDAGAGDKPNAAIVVRPRVTKPLLPAMPHDGDAGDFQGPSISIPVTLPKGSAVVVEDAGAP